MYKKIWILLIMAIALFLAACGESAPAESEPPADINLSGQDIDEENALTTVDSTEEAARPTVTPLPPSEEEADDEAYPGLLPTATSLPEGYPAKPATVSPYPGPGAEGEVLPQPDVDFASMPAGIATAWVVAPSGVQCDEDARQYEDIVAAVEALNEADVDVYDGVTESRVVCAACGCPESTHYRLQIDEADIETAESLGFVAETE